MNSNDNIPELQSPFEQIREVDARSKGLDNVNTTSGDLLKELVTFIVS